MPQAHINEHAYPLDRVRKGLIYYRDSREDTIGLCIENHPQETYSLYAVYYSGSNTEATELSLLFDLADLTRCQVNSHWVHDGGLLAKKVLNLLKYLIASFYICPQHEQ